MKEPIEKAISSDEKILWKGSRNKPIMIFYLILSFSFIFLISLFFFMNETISHSAFSSGSTPGHSVSILVLIVGLIITTAIYHSKEEYVYIITDKKILIRKGGLNADIIYIEHDSIKSLKLKQNLSGHLFNVGNIFIDSGKRIVKQEKYSAIKNASPEAPKIIYDKIKYVKNPIRIFNLLKRTIDLNKKE